MHPVKAVFLPFRRLEGWGRDLLSQQHPLGISKKLFYLESSGALARVADQQDLSDSG